EDQRLRDDEPREGARGLRASAHRRQAHGADQPARREREPRLQHQVAEQHMGNDTALDGRSLLRKTLITMAAMVGACVAFVGTLTLICVVIVRGAVGPASPASESPTLIPADKIHGAPPGAPGATTGAVPAANKPNTISPT